MAIPPHWCARRAKADRAYPRSADPVHSLRHFGNLRDAVRFGSCSLWLKVPHPKQGPNMTGALAENGKDSEAGHSCAAGMRGYADTAYMAKKRKRGTSYCRSAGIAGPIEIHIWRRMGIHGCAWPWDDWPELLCELQGPFREDLTRVSLFPRTPCGGALPNS